MIGGTKRIFTAPERIEIRNKKSIFLAGTIEMGSSEDWQSKVSKDIRLKNFDIYNPRREKWDSSLEQSFENPQFFQQVTWEADALSRASLIIINFLSKSLSPISLLELGLHANSGKVLVCCPDDFWRSGNVQIVCNQYKIPLFKTLTELLDYI